MSKVKVVERPDNDYDDDDDEAPLVFSPQPLLPIIIYVFRGKIPTETIIFVLLPIKIASIHILIRSRLNIIVLIQQTF